MNAASPPPPDTEFGREMRRQAIAEEGRRLGDERRTGKDRRTVPPLTTEEMLADAERRFKERRFKT